MSNVLHLPEAIARAYRSRTVFQLVAPCQQQILLVLHLCRPPWLVHCELTLAQALTGMELFQKPQLMGGSLHQVRTIVNC